MKELKSAYVCETHDHRRGDGPYSDLDDHLNLYTDIFSPKFLFAFSFHTNQRLWKLFINRNRHDTLEFQIENNIQSAMVFTYCVVRNREEVFY